MAQSLAEIYVHIVFSTKHRRAWLGTSEIRQEVHRRLATICRQQSSPSICIGGVEDHVHILCRLSRTVSVSGLVKELKRDSSKWIKRSWPTLEHFYWQSGYGAFSISPAHLEAIENYVRDQELHHRRESFQDEYRRLLTKYRVDFDEQHVWD